eukprot:gene10345-2481_t
MDTGEDGAAVFISVESSYGKKNRSVWDDTKAARLQGCMQCGCRVGGGVGGGGGGGGGGFL